jgi:hypothetical protein
MTRTIVNSCRGVRTGLPATIITIRSRTGIYRECAEVACVLQ